MSLSLLNLVMDFIHQSQNQAKCITSSYSNSMLLVSAVIYIEWKSRSIFKSQYSKFGHEYAQ